MNLTLADIRNALAERDGNRSFLMARRDEVRLSDDGRLVTSGGRHALSDKSRVWLARQAGIPVHFFRELSADLQAVLFNRLFPLSASARELPDELRVSLQGEVVVGFSGGQFPLLSNLKVLEAALDTAPPGLKENENAFEVGHFELNGRFGLSLVSRDLSAEPRVGDVVRAGIDIDHSDAGERGTQISSYFLRLVCRNGMLARVCEHGEALRVRRGGPESHESVLNRIRHLAGLAWTDLSGGLRLLRVLSQETVDDPEAVLEKIIRDHGLAPSRKFLRQLLQALSQDELGNGGTLYDALNAISRVETHSASRPLAWRRCLLFASGEILRERFERCPQCRSILRRHRT